MSDLAATNCGCGCDNNCGNGILGGSNNSCWILILILLFGCGNNGCNDCNDNTCLIIILLLFCGCGNNNGMLCGNGCGCN